MWIWMYVIASYLLMALFIRYAVTHKLFNYSGGEGERGLVAAALLIAPYAPLMLIVGIVFELIMRPLGWATEKVLRLKPNTNS